MAQETAARFFKAVQHDQELKEKIKATSDPETFIQIAAQRGYKFTIEDLENAIGKLSEEQVAAMINPGIGPRRHLLPR